MKFEIWKLTYCLLWSVALFVSTFYSLFDHVEKAFVFTDAKQYERELRDRLANY